MKVLMVTPAFFPSLGGIEQHVMNLSKQLISKNHAVDVLTAKIGDTSKCEKMYSVNVFRVNAGINSQQELSFKGRKLILPFFLKALSLQLKNKYDLIHVHCPFSLLSCLPLKLFGVPVVLTVHGNWINCVKGRRYYKKKICLDYDINRCTECMHSNKPVMNFKRWVLRNSAEACNAIIAVSSDVKNSIQLKKKKEIYVIPNVAFSEKIIADKVRETKPPFNSEKKKILFLGSLIEEKGAKVLLETAKNIDAQFIFVYSYAEEKYLQEFTEFIKKNSLENVFLFHKVPNEEVRQFFIPLSDVIVLPSLWPEPCSSVVTEASSAKKPVIASNAGGFPDLISGNETGLLFEPGNSAELEKKNKINS
ncbi:MAG: glycosyltransferase family 4 protein [archaeon]